MFRSFPLGFTRDSPWTTGVTGRETLAETRELHLQVHRTKCVLRAKPRHNRNCTNSYSRSLFIMSSRALNDLRSISARDMHAVAMNDPDEIPLIGLEQLYNWDFWRSVVAEYVGMTFFLFITIGTVIFGS